VSIGFVGAKTDPLVRLRKAYRLCAQVTANLERYRAEHRPRAKAEYFGRAVVDVRNIQAEIEAAGVSLKKSVIIDTELTDEWPREKS
jgi:hypothetical protein